MNHKLNTNEIKQLLNRSVAQIDKGTLNRLESARRTALQYQQTQQTPVLAWLTQHGLVHGHSTHNRKVFNFGIAALLALVLFGSVLYLHHAYDHDHSDIDIAILTDDLPVDMYVD